MLLTTVLLMYIYTACWLNNYVVQLCPFWCNSYGARLSRLLTTTLSSICKRERESYTFMFDCDLITLIE